MVIDKNAIEEIPQFNVGDEVVSKSNGIKCVVTYQDGTSVTTWFPNRTRSSLGYYYLSPCIQVYNAYAIKKTGKTYPELSKALKEMMTDTITDT